MPRFGLPLPGRAEEMQNQRCRHQPDAIPASVRRPRQAVLERKDYRKPMPNKKGAEAPFLLTTAQLKTRHQVGFL